MEVLEAARIVRVAVDLVRYTGPGAAVHILRDLEGLIPIGGRGTCGGLCPRNPKGPF